MDTHTLGCCSLAQPTYRDYRDLVKKIKTLATDIVIDECMVVMANHDPKPVLSISEGKLADLLNLIRRL